MTENSCTRRIESPIGPILLTASGGALVRVELCGSAAGVSAEPSVGASVSRSDEALLKRAEKQFGEYFAGRRKRFDLPLEPSGTPFQLAVWGQLARIGFGETSSYGHLANDIGKPQAARAIGGAVGSNPLPLVIGCHRVLAGDGRLTGYSGADGLSTKRWLLGHEGIEYRE